jgi:hypothetical protein
LSVDTFLNGLAAAFAVGSFLRNLGRGSIPMMLCPEGAVRR